MIQYHNKAGAYPYLSEIYACPMTFDGSVWPTAQHAYQAAKICPSLGDIEVNRLKDEIRKQTDLKEVRKIGKNLKMKPELFDRGKTLELMFKVIFSKFKQNRRLALRLLLDTKDKTEGYKPIWHIDTDGFWGTSRLTPQIGTEPTVAAAPDGARSMSAGRRSAAERKWYAGDNWNGKILSVVRELLREEMKDELARGPQARCREPQFAEAAASRKFAHRRPNPQRGGAAGCRPCWTRRRGWCGCTAPARRSTR